jgi:hypothetical protein
MAHGGKRSGDGHARWPGKGVFWWEPAAGRGLQQRGFFDADHNSEPVLDAFLPYTRPIHRTDDQKPPRVPPSALKFGPAP